MRPLNFEGSNKLLGKPEGWDVGTCVPLPVFTDGTTCVSRWILEDSEREVIAAGGEIWLQVAFGDTQPPVMLLVAPPDMTAEGISDD